MTHTTGVGLLLAIMTFGAIGIQADVLNLADGSRLVGTVEQIDATEARLSGTFAGDLSVPRDAIVSIETESTVTVQMSDGAYLTGKLTPGESGNLVQVDELGTRVVPIADVKGVYREDPQELQRRELAVKLAAAANVGVNVTSGNSDSRNYHIDGNVVTRTKRNRYTVAGEYNEEESDDILVKQNWTGLVKYDYFVSEKWFWFNSATFEHDEFADLDLRSALAGGFGYQFFDTDARSLSVEFGPSYIDENFEVAEDDSFIGTRWAIDYKQRLWDGLSFYHYEEGLWGLEDTSNLTIRTRTGLQMDVTEHIIARLQTAIDWDKSPPDGTKGTDYENTLSVGYRF